MPVFRYSLGRVKPLSVPGYRDAARRALPSVAWAYLDGGADDLATLNKNRAAFGRWGAPPARPRRRDGAQPDDHGRGNGALDARDARPDRSQPIADRVGGRATVLLDGGVRRGTDVVKALCLGAETVLIGRAFLYGLAVAGEAGVADILRILREELNRALVLMGCPGVEHLDRSWLA